MPGGIGCRLSEDGEAVIILFGDVYYGRFTREGAVAVAEGIKRIALTAGVTPAKESLN